MSSCDGKLKLSKIRGRKIFTSTRNKWQKKENWKDGMVNRESWTALKQLKTLVGLVTSKRPAMVALSSSMGICNIIKDSVLEQVLRVNKMWLSCFQCCQGARSSSSGCTPRLAYLAPQWRCRRGAQPGPACPSRYSPHGQSISLLVFTPRLVRLRCRMPLLSEPSS